MDPRNQAQTEHQLPGGWGNAGRARPRPVNIGRPRAVVRRHHLLRDRQRGALEVSAIWPVVCEDKNGQRKGGTEGQEGEGVGFYQMVLSSYPDKQYSHLTLTPCECIF